MSDARSDSSKRKRSDSAHAERVRIAPLTDTEIPVAGSSDDILDSAPPPTDDTPTTITKNPLKHPPLPDDGIRGRRLAHFELLEQIGAGGMAAVLRARDTQLDRIVALKILPPDLANDAENIQRFHQEARSAAKLDHENIARVFFCGEDQRLNFIAFEFVEGENLRTILDRRGRLPVAEALPYILQVAAGLAHAAERGVVHRDIKPSNIIITPAGRAKLVDMGLARSLGPQKDSGLTHSGVTLGTFDYISPEQALEPRDADVRSDIYSLGCTFYHMVTGRIPVPEGTAAKKLHYHQHIAPPDPRELIPSLPDEVALILDRMMAKDPRARYQSAGELVQHLLTAAKHLRVGAEVPEGVLFIETPLPRTGTGRPYLLVGLAVVAVVTLLWFLDQPVAVPDTQPRRQVVETKDDGRKKPENKDGQADKTTTPVKVLPKPVVPEVVEPGSVQFTYKSENKPEDLFAWLDEKATRAASRVTLLLACNLNLEVSASSVPRELIIAAADKVTVTSAPGVRARPAIRLIINGGASLERAALRMKARETALLDVQIVIDAQGADVPLIGVALEGEKHEIRGCDFLQKQGGAARLTSLLAGGTLAVPTANVRLNATNFLAFKNDAPKTGSDVGGQDAITFRGPVDLIAKDCAFGPHQVTFRLDGKDERLELDHCSVMAADQSTVFQLLKAASAHLEIEHSLFARPGGLGLVSTTDPTGAVFISLSTDGQKCTYTGSDNGFQGLKPRHGDSTSIVGIGDFISAIKGDDNGSRLIDERINPWVNSSAAGILKAGDDLVERTFLPAKDVAGLRQFGDPKSQRLIGIETLAGKPLLGDLPIIVARPLDELTVDPTGQSDSLHGKFVTLEAAVEAAKPGDKILIHHDGDLRLDKMIRLERVVDLTIRASKGSRPTLVLGQTVEKEAALFKLYQNGQLRLEDVEVRIRPPQLELGKPGYLTQSVVHLLGDGQCSFKNCVITLDQGNQMSTSLAVAMMPENDNVMKMDMKTDPATPPRVEGKPHVFFSNCFVRGTGDLFRNQTGRPCDVDVTGSLVAVTGSFCNVDVAGNAAASDQRSVLRLEKTTAYLGGQFLRVGGKELKDIDKQLPAHLVNAAECLFLPAAAGQALVRIETQDTTEMDGLEEKLKKRVVWEATRTNGFGDFDPFLRHSPTGSDSVETVFALKSTGEWKSFLGASDQQLRFHITLAKPLERDSAFPILTPDQMRPREQLDAGADLTALQKLLPAPNPR